MSTRSWHQSRRLRETSRLRFADQHDVGIGDRLDDLRPGTCGVEADEDEAVGGECGAVADPPLLEVDRHAQGRPVAADSAAGRALMRARNTYAVHPWYRSTTGKRITATHVMTVSA